MINKIIIALDYNTFKASKDLIDNLGERISFYKVGLEAFLNYGDEIIEYLKSKNKKIFLDLKFNDIPNTVLKASEYAINKKVDIFNVHTTIGPKAIKLVSDFCKTNKYKGIFTGVTILTSFSESEFHKTFYLTNEIKNTVLDMAKSLYENGAKGIVCSSIEAKIIKKYFPNLITICPGIHFESKPKDQCRTLTPKEAFDNGADYIVIGRSVTHSQDPVNTVNKIIDSLNISKSVLYKNCILSNGSEVDIEVDDKNIITNISSNEVRKDFQKIIDCNKKIIIPGMIDMHTHMRSMELSYKEDYKSASEACLNGGVTTFFDMPNTIPLTVNLNSLLKKINTYNNDSIIQGYFYLGLNKDIKYETILECLPYIKGIKIFLDETTGKMNFDTHLLDSRIFDLDIVYLFHAEDESILSIPNLFKNKNAKVHICHISSKKEYLYMQEIKHIMPNVTFEVAPHHLILNKTNFLGNLSNVKPSLKTPDDNRFLLNLLKENKIDIIASDHAPHLLTEKIEKGLYGYPGLETTLPLLLTLANKGILSYERLEKITSNNIAKLFNLKKIGKIKIGYYFNVVFIDKNLEYKILNENIKSKAKWTPYSNIKFTGKILKTICTKNGEKYE